MHNPFGLLTTRLLDALIKAGNRYFVRQTYARGLNPLDASQQAAFLFTHYENAADAMHHFTHIANDPNRFLYDSNNPEHLARLQVAARQTIGYPVYTSLLEKPWQPSEKMREKIRRYITHTLNWIPARSDTVEIKLICENGELFVNLKYRLHEASVPLADIEK